MMSDRITAGQDVTVVVSASPGSHISLRAYSRPATSYATVRTTRVTPSNGLLTYRIRPVTNTRLLALSAECGASNSQAVSVHGVLSLSVKRLSVRAYDVTGRYLPGSPNEGRLVKLYYRTGDRVVQKAAGFVHGGRVALTVRFSGSGRLDLFLASGNNITNLGSASRDRSVFVGR